MAASPPAMGYEIHRFQEDVDEELLCPICSSVLKDAVQTPSCEHAFCSSCISEWLTQQSTCPVDRNPVAQHQLRPVPRILRNLLGRLLIACDNASLGCAVVVRLDALPAHIGECEFNPTKPVACDRGCGLVVPKNELAAHNCVRELRTLVQSQAVRVDELHAELAAVRQALDELRRELQIVKDPARMFRAAAAAAAAAGGSLGGRGGGGLGGGGGGMLARDQHDHHQLMGGGGSSSSGGGTTDEVLRWLASLPHARVTRWGGMISTPDAVLQAVIKRSLVESGCPPRVAGELMENSHERRWPAGLSTLETRQLSRQLYENYATKRIPGKQAVVAMAVENRHMPDDMIVEPGIVMIFAHGVE